MSEGRFSRREVSDSNELMALVEVEMGSWRLVGMDYQANAKVANARDVRCWQVLMG